MTSCDVMEISPIVPVIALDRVEDALPLAVALLEGGVGIMEITLRTAAGLGSIEAIAAKMPQMRVGAGTVVNSEDFKNALSSGAEFVFSPGISTELIDISKQLDKPFIPGVATASEVMLAQNNELYCAKLFPATVAGGVDALKAFSGPFPKMAFCPTGGVTKGNMKDFLALANVKCVGGTWIVPKEAIKSGDFKKITTLCREALSLLQ